MCDDGGAPGPDCWGPLTPMRSMPGLDGLLLHLPVECLQDVGELALYQRHRTQAGGQGWTGAGVDISPAE